MANRRCTQVEQHQEQRKFAGEEAEDQSQPARDLNGRRQHRPRIYPAGQTRHEMREAGQVPPMVDPRHQIK